MSVPMRTTWGGPASASARRRAGTRLPRIKTTRTPAPPGQRGGQLSSKRFARSIPTARGVPDTFQDKEKCPFRCALRGKDRALLRLGAAAGRDAATTHETARVPSPPGQWQQPAVRKNFARPFPGAHCAGKDRALFLRFSSLMPAPPRPPARGPGSGCRPPDRARRPSTAALPLPRRAVPPAGLRRSDWRR